MKLLALILLIIPLCLMPFSKKEEEVIYPTYKDGDILEYDGLIYEYDVFSFDENDNIIAPTYDYKDPVDTLYHQAYYFDMIHPENYPDITLGLSDLELWDENGNSYAYGIEPFSQINTISTWYAPETKEQFYNGVDDVIKYRLDYYLNGVMAFETYNKIHYYYKYDDNPGFWWVKGVGDNKKEKYVIPSKIADKYVIGIGYNALNKVDANAINVLDVDTSNFKGIDLYAGTMPFILMPYAISDASISNLNIERNCLLFPRALDNLVSRNIYFKYMAGYDASFNNVSVIRNLIIDKLHVSQNSWNKQDNYYPELDSSFGYIYPLFNECDLDMIRCPQITQTLDGTYYAHHTYTGYVDSFDGSNFDFSELLTMRLCANNKKPKYLFLAPGGKTIYYVQNGMVQNYLTKDGFCDELEYIFILEGMRGHQTYYEAKDGYIYFGYKNYAKTVKFIKIPPNCKVITLDNDMNIQNLG